MKILSIEPTPSPNTMKIILDESLPDKETKSYKKEQSDEAPEYLKRLLGIEGVKAVFQVADFIALERFSKTDWQMILPEVRTAFGEEAGTGRSADINIKNDERFGEVKVFVQLFRGIPMQVKLDNGAEERRFGLEQRFIDAAMKAESSSENLVMERKWKEQGVRYGDMEDIGEEVTQEIMAAYDDKRLNALVQSAFHDKADDRTALKITTAELAEALHSTDWKVRYGALEKLDPSEKDIPLLAKALHDEKVSIRRLATVYFGMIESEEALPYIYQALNDPAVTVRRTAGDCISDIGNPKAIPAMVKALKDKNKLVRWRAAMFLYEAGDETALEALREAENDDEFEVSLQVKMAIKRIESGEEAAGSVWQQMTNVRKEK